MPSKVTLIREKIETLGVEAMRNEELLANALSIRLNFADKIIKQYPPQTLVGLRLEELEQLKSIGKARGLSLIAAVEFVRRALNQGIGIEPSITKPSEAVVLLAPYKDKRKEHFIAIFLNARNQVIMQEEVTIGTINSSLVHPREVFYSAVGSCAAGVILRTITRPVTLRPVGKI